MQPAGVGHEKWRINGIDFHLALAGAGEPVVLLHGFPELWYSWRRIIPKLAGSYRVIAPDMRGYGETDRPRSGYDLDTLAADVAGIIDRAGGRALLAGHDWGGMVGWHVAITHPEKVKAFVAVSAPHVARHLQVLLRSPRQALMGMYVNYFQIPFIPQLILSAGRGWLMKNIMEMSAVREGAFTPEEMAVYRRAWADRESMRAGIEYYRQLVRGLPRTVRLYNRVKVKPPVCVVWADKDRFLSTASAQGMERWCEIPPEVHIIENCGHWIPMEAPEELHGILADFMGGTES